MPVASVNIPEQALPDLKRIAELDDALFDSLLKAIGDSSPTLTKTQFSSALAEKVGTADDEDIQAVLKTAFALYTIKERAGITGQDLSEAVAASAAVSSPEFQLPPEAKDRLQHRLSLLLGFDKTLGISAKALDVMTDHERIFCKARILSDLRPVFTDQLECASAMIIHTLQIGFHQDGEHHDYYFALDTDDIQKLKGIIDRAERKTVALQSLLKKADMRYLEV
jgi:hypothetical protein